MSLIFYGNSFVSDDTGSGGLIAVWGEPFKPVSALRPEDVDAAIWPIVQHINASGWIETTESCAGHDGGAAILGFATDDLGRALQCLADAVLEGEPDTRADRRDPNVGGFHVGLYTPARSSRKYTVRVVLDGRYLDAFARRLNP